MQMLLMRKLRLHCNTTVAVSLCIRIYNNNRTTPAGGISMHCTLYLHIRVIQPPLEVHLRPPIRGMDVGAPRGGILEQR
jgi:hypothetical protein